MLSPMRVANDELLSIGRFAQLTGLTAKALRHYDELGLLRPAHVDDVTGYRWYSLEQSRDAVAIRRLRAFELPLDEIAEVLRGDDALLRERLAVQRARLEGRAVVTERMIDELDRLLRGEEELVPCAQRSTTASRTCRSSCSRRSTDRRASASCRFRS